MPVVDGPGQGVELLDLEQVTPHLRPQLRFGHVQGSPVAGKIGVRNSTAASGDEPPTAVAATLDGTVVTLTMDEDRSRDLVKFHSGHGIADIAGNAVEAGEVAVAFEGRLGRRPGAPALDGAAVELSNVSGAWLEDGEATGTIENADLLPAALLARFGRATAEQVVTHIEERMAAPRRRGFRARLAGRELQPGGERDFALGLLSSFAPMGTGLGGAAPMVVTTAKRAPVRARAASAISCSTVSMSRLALMRRMAAESAAIRSRAALPPPSRFAVPAQWGSFPNQRTDSRPARAVAARAGAPVSPAWGSSARPRQPREYKTDTAFDSNSTFA